MDQVVSDPNLAAVIQQRLDEARPCHDCGAYIATIIMLGSLLEGVLLFAAEERLAGPPPKPFDRMGLQDLIALARRERWIQVDVKIGSELSLAEAMISGLGGSKMTPYETGSTHLEFPGSGSVSGIERC